MKDFATPNFLSFSYFYNNAQFQSINHLFNRQAEDVKLTLEEAAARASKIPEDISNLSNSLR